MLIYIERTWFAKYLFMGHSTEKDYAKQYLFQAVDYSMSM